MSIIFYLLYLANCQKFLYSMAPYYFYSYYFFYYYLQILPHLNSFILLASYHYPVEIISNSHIKQSLTLIIYHYSSFSNFIMLLQFTIGDYFMININFNFIFFIIPLSIFLYLIIVLIAIVYFIISVYLIIISIIAYLICSYLYYFRNYLFIFGCFISILVHLTLI